MSGTYRFLVAVLGVFGVVVAGAAFGEETQDSPLYAYTLKTTLERLEGQATIVTEEENPLGGVLPPEGQFLQAATSQPLGPTVCHPQKTLCPVRTTACPSPVATACPQRTTRCPAVLTQCPNADTTCPERHTRCPGGATNCPIQRTQCPARDTACPPAVATVCPRQRTQCPVVNTACPATVATQCPQKTTECPAQTTHCPFNATTCPPAHTRCPAQATYCPLNDTVCPAHVTKCPGDLPTACPQRSTRCPVRQTVCPGGTTNCPIANTACPVVGTMCPAAACGPGAPIVSFLQPAAGGESSYDRSNPGVLVMYCQLTLDAVAAAIPGVEDMIRVVIEPIGTVPGGSLLEWWAPNPVPPGGVSLSPWVGSALGQPANTHPLMGKARLNTDPTSPAFGTYEVSAIFTGLPDRNDFFGVKNVYAQIVQGATVVATTPQTVEVFYDRIGRTWYIPNPFNWAVDPNLPVYNNPGTGTEYGPNWYYYWKNPRNTLNNNARVILDSPHDWQYYHEYTYGFYYPGDPNVFVGAAAEWMNSGPEYYQNKYTGAWICIAGTGIGPHCCGEVVAHEGMHKAIWETWEPMIMLAETDGEDDGDPYDDPDDDGVPNRFEPGYMWDAGLPATIPGGPRAPAIIVCSPDDPDTYDLAAMYWGYASYGDQEVLCRAIEIDISQTPPGLNAGGMTVDDTWDWCMPGTNSNPPYDPTLQANPWPW